jgi:hypothetical protein
MVPHKIVGRIVLKDDHEIFTTWWIYVFDLTNLMLLQSYKRNLYDWFFTQIFLMTTIVIDSFLYLILFFFFIILIFLQAYGIHYMHHFLDFVNLYDSCFANPKSFSLAYQTSFLNNRMAVDLYLHQYYLDFISFLELIPCKLNSMIFFM